MNNYINKIGWKKNQPCFKQFNNLIKNNEIDLYKIDKLNYYILI